MTELFERQHPLISCLLPRWTHSANWYERVCGVGVQLLFPSPVPGEEAPVRPEALPPLPDALKANRSRRSRKVLVIVPDQRSTYNDTPRSRWHLPTKR